MPTRVVNRKLYKFSVYIGRPEIWGNPFTHHQISMAQFVVANRSEAVARHKEWILTQPHLLARVHELRGKVLGCWCKPLACHGDFLAMLADSCCEVCKLPTYDQSRVGEEGPTGEDRWWHINCAPREMRITDKDHYP